MIYKCRNCGANAVYSPEKGTMYCPYCDSQDSEELAPGGGMAVCMNCGGELKPGDYMSAVKCEHCGTYVIFEERTEGCYKPHVILPFKLGKKEVQERIRARYAKSAFIPADFLSDAKLSEIEGMYIPFFCMISTAIMISGQQEARYGHGEAETMNTRRRLCIRWSEMQRSISKNCR